MKHSSTREVYAYWDTLRGSRLAPERGDIEPGALRHVLHDTFVLENGPIGPIFRLAGTRLCAMFGGELKNRPFIALWPDVESQGDIRRLATVVMDESASAVAGFQAETANGHAISLELLLLPLRHRGRTHVRLLGALSPATSPDWLGLDTIMSVRLVSIRMIWANERRSPLRENEIVSPERRRASFVLHTGGRM